MTITEVATVAKEYRVLQTLIKDLENQAEDLKAQMIEELKSRDVDTLQADIFTIKYVNYSNNRLDTTALKKELPDIAAKYTKPTSMYRFQIT